MTRILILYYSSYGRVRAKAQAVANGAAEIPGTVVDVKRVPETVRQSAGFIADDTAEAQPRTWPDMTGSSSAPRHGSA